MTDEIRELAEKRLAAREAKHGPVADRERYLAAAIRGIAQDRAEVPKSAAVPRVDHRPHCGICDGNGWIYVEPEGSYTMVKRCVCDHGRVNTR